MADDSTIPKTSTVSAQSYQAGSAEQDPRLQDMGFRFPLRKYQQEILGLINEKLDKGERQFHIVAPPGAGKTIIGLQIISQFKCPSLILSPNTTIQSQWGQKLDLFLPIGMESIVGPDILGTHEDKPLKPVTTLTYQVLSTPGREQEYIDKLAHQAWVNELTKGRSLSLADAEMRVLEIMQNNPKAFRQEISRHSSRLRKKLSEVLDLKEVLHPNAIELLQSLRRQRFGLVIFDECHHLTDYWAAIMTHLVKQLGDPVIIGLTGTPPEGKSTSQEGRYLSLVGDIDYQVPTPALVREGGLAPFQDLVYFTEPTEKEFQFLEEQHIGFHELIKDLTTPKHKGVADGAALVDLDFAPEQNDDIRIGVENVNTQETSGSLPITTIDFDDEFDSSLSADLFRREEQEELDTQEEIFSAESETVDTSAQPMAPELVAFDSPASYYFKNQQAKEASKKRIVSELAAAKLESEKQAKEAQSNSDDKPKKRASRRSNKRDEPIPKKLNTTRLESMLPLSQKIDSKAHIETEVALYNQYVNKNGHDENEERPHSVLSAWVSQRITEVTTARDAKSPDVAWHVFANNNKELSQAISRFMWRDKRRFGFKLELSEVLMRAPDIEDWMILLEDMASRKLKLSPAAKDHKLYERIKAATRKLGYAITEQGLRKQASPVDRVLAFSNSKPEAVTEILEMEYRSLEDRLRAAVVTDFEKMSATSIKTLDGVLDEESGGAIAAMRTLLAHPISNFINPCLVTGSHLLTDKRITKQFVAKAQELLLADGKLITLLVKEDESSNYSAITANSSEWESRLYVGLATAIFEIGITKCLIGTRGLFGEGWDSQALNTLIDLTTTTSPVSVKQLRGRSIRIQTNDAMGARKVANNWDVVCVAPQLEKGLNDYQRFVRKHNGYFGLCDDGQIESGVGHVHPSLSELTPIEVFASSEAFNREMLDRALIRDKIYDLWKVGQPYRNRLIGCVELNRLRNLALTPPHLKRDMKYKEHAKQLRTSLNAIWFEFGGLGACVSLAAMCFTGAQVVLMMCALAPFAASLVLAQKKYANMFSKIQKEICRPNTQESSLTDIAFAVLTAMQTVKLLPTTILKESIKTSIRSDGSYRVFLDNIEPAHSKAFTNSLKEVMSPITNQPYLIPKYEYFINGEDEVAAKKERKFFRSYLRGRSEPRVACYHPVPNLLARSEKGRRAFEASWNKYVSPGFVLDTETKPELLNRYFGLGPSLAQRLLWE